MKIEHIVFLSHRHKKRCTSTRALAFSDTLKQGSFESRNLQELFVQEVSSVQKLRFVKPACSSLHEDPSHPFLHFAEGPPLSEAVNETWVTDRKWLLSSLPKKEGTEIISRKHPVNSEGGQIHLPDKYLPKLFQKISNE